MAKRYISPCALPDTYDREVLTILIEECAEVQQRATKLLRFGKSERQPGQRLTNKDRLSLEIGDLEAMIELAEGAGLVSSALAYKGSKAKLKKLRRFMQSGAFDPEIELKGHRTPTTKESA